MFSIPFASILQLEILSSFRKKEDTYLRAFFHDFSGHIVADDTLARLISMPNVIVTSHQAFLTREALSNIADTTLQNIREFFEEDTCKNEICYKCTKVSTCAQAHTGKCFA